MEPGDNVSSPEISVVLLANARGGAYHIGQPPFRAGYRLSCSSSAFSLQLVQSILVGPAALDLF